MTNQLFAAGVALVCAAPVAGCWFGEGSRVLWSPLLLGAAFGFALVPVAATSEPRGRRAVASTVIFAAFWLGWTLGTQEFSLAYNEAIAAGPEVQRLLAAHRVRTGSYPASLDELAGDVPGTRLLRGPVWKYTRTSEGYSLEVSDWLVTHRGTHDSEWRAWK